jgi:predicted nucleic acid-binding protein
MSYWDSSALAKLFVLEPDSVSFRKLAAANFPLVASFLARCELATTFRRRETEGSLWPGAARELRERFDRLVRGGRIVLEPEKDSLRGKFEAVLDDCFSASPPVFVRTNDALHIAAAHTAGQSALVTADIRQKKAAELCGLTVLP